jgi:hypothetical protein
MLSFMYMALVRQAQIMQPLLRSCDGRVKSHHTRYVRGSRFGGIGGGSGLAGTALGQDYACWFAENSQHSASGGMVLDHTMCDVAIGGAQ